MASASANTFESVRRSMRAVNAAYSGAARSNDERNSRAVASEFGIEGLLRGEGGCLEDTALDRSQTAVIALGTANSSLSAIKCGKIYAGRQLIERKSR